MKVEGLGRAPSPPPPKYGLGCQAVRDDLDISDCFWYIQCHLGSNFSKRGLWSRLFLSEKRLSNLLPRVEFGLFTCRSDPQLILYGREISFSESQFDMSSGRWKKSIWSLNDGMRLDRELINNLINLQLARNEINPALFLSELRLVLPQNCDCNKIGNTGVLAGTWPGARPCTQILIGPDVILTGKVLGRWIFRKENTQYTSNGTAAWGVPWSQRFVFQQFQPSNKVGQD
jgi:hypothetical protein